MSACKVNLLNMSKEVFKNVSIKVFVASFRVLSSAFGHLNPNLVNVLLNSIVI